MGGESYTMHFSPGLIRPKLWLVHCAIPVAEWSISAAEEHDGVLRNMYRERFRPLSCGPFPGRLAQDLSSNRQDWH